MEASKGLQDILTASRAAMDSIRAVQRKAEDGLLAIGKQQALMVADRAQGAVKIALESLYKATGEYLKNIGDAKLSAMNKVWEQQDKAVEHINLGLVAIDEAKQEAVAAIRAEVEAGRQGVRDVADSEEKQLFGIAKEMEIVLKERPKD